MKTKNINLIKFLTIFFLLIVPFSISDYSDNVEPEKITSDLRFYEINTCSISLNEFLIKKSKCNIPRSLQNKIQQLFIG